MKNFGRYLKRALAVTLVLLVLCGVVYPLLLTAAGQAIFPKQANGSIVKVNGKAAGSEIVGQEFEGDQYFHGRISSVNYNTYTKEEKESGEYEGVSSGSFNYAPSSKDLEKRVEEDVKAFKERYKEVTGEEFKGEIPADMLTASGSGLDPHISTEAAKVQLPIVAAASGLSEEEVQNIVDNNTEKKVFGIFGEEEVNVLECNIDIAEAMGE